MYVCHLHENMCPCVHMYVVSFPTHACVGGTGVCTMMVGEHATVGCVSVCVGMHLSVYTHICIMYKHVAESPCNQRNWAMRFFFAAMSASICSFMLAICLHLPAVAQSV